MYVHFVKLSNHAPIKQGNLAKLLSCELGLIVNFQKPQNNLKSLVWAFILLLVGVQGLPSYKYLGQTLSTENAIGTLASS